LIALNALRGYRNAMYLANQAHDRALYLAARTLAEEVVWQGGVVQVDLLRGAGYLFSNHTGSRLHFKIQSLDGMVLAGDASVPEPASEAPDPVRFFSLVTFHDAEHLGQPVRLARLIHVVDAPRAASAPLIRVTVIETLEARQGLIQQALRDTLISQGLLLVAVALLVVWGVQRGMRPLDRYRQRLSSRQDDDLSPMDEAGMPRELRPLVSALNGYLQRLQRLVESRKRFLDNAAHQLRTPLTALSTQLAVAARGLQRGATGPLPQDHPLVLVEAARRTTEGAVHLAQQLLMLTRVEHAGELDPHGPVDLCRLARQVVDERALRAHQSGQDLGLELGLACFPVDGNETLLHDALANLVDNALHHNPIGTCVTVRVVSNGVEVEDDGVGIPAPHLPHVFERFYRAAEPGRVGSGLGLAIVQDIALHHGAAVQAVSPPPSGRGTCIRMVWPEIRS
ncbi:MAG: HAMP domain-containing protein, partial [Rhodoferax sp.]|nr:HAMP domain-containing protein [Rhodoferax sp.]